MKKNKDKNGNRENNVDIYDEGWREGPKEWNELSSQIQNKWRIQVVGKYLRWIKVKRIKDAGVMSAVNGE